MSFNLHFAEPQPKTRMVPVVTRVVLGATTFVFALGMIAVADVLSTGGAYLNRLFLW